VAGVGPTIEPLQLVAAGPLHHLGLARTRPARSCVRAGIQPDPVAYQRVERMADAALATAMHATIAVVDPISPGTANSAFTTAASMAASWRTRARPSSACPFPHARPQPATRVA